MRPTLGSQKAVTISDYDDEKDGDKQQNNASISMPGVEDMLSQMNPTRYLSKPECSFMGIK